MQSVRSPVVEDAIFIRESTSGLEPVAVLAQYQASLLAEANRKPATSSIAELLTYDDATAVIEKLIQHGPTDLFLQATLLSDPMLLYQPPWIRDNFTRIERQYRQIGIGPGGRLVHFQRRPQ